MNNEQIDQHLDAAIGHIKSAIELSVADLSADEKNRLDIGGKWQQFLAEFFRVVKQKSKESKINLLNLISFSKLR